MRSFVAAITLLYSLQGLAQEPQRFCEFLLLRTQTDPSAKLIADGAKAKLDELMAIHRFTSGFEELAATAIDRKISWDSFQKMADDKDITLSDYYQPLYDKKYLDRYCGAMKTEATVKVEGGHETVLSGSTSFEKKPDPKDHEYWKNNKPTGDR